jgi:hypothetical protein
MNGSLWFANSRSFAKKDEKSGGSCTYPIRDRTVKENPGMQWRPVWKAVPRFGGYWLLVLFLCLEQAVSRVFGFFSAVALVFHLRGWRDARFSRIAVACLSAQTAFLVADHFFNIIVLCCT